MKLDLSNGTSIEVGVDFYSKSLSIKQFHNREGELQFSDENSEVVIKIPFIDLKKLVDFIKDVYKLAS
jgi:hypothetical protein